MDWAQHMRVVLGACRSQGLDFDAAWGKAINTLPRNHPDRDEWLAILKWARPAYQASYAQGDWAVIARPAKLDADNWSDNAKRVKPGRLAGDESQLVAAGAGGSGTIGDPGPLLAFVAAALGVSSGDDPELAAIIDPADDLRRSEPATPVSGRSPANTPKRAPAARSAPSAA